LVSIVGLETARHTMASWLLARHYMVPVKMNVGMAWYDFYTMLPKFLPPPCKKWRRSSKK